MIGKDLTENIVKEEQVPREVKEQIYTMCGLLNIDASLSAYLDCKPSIEIKECYINVFHIFSANFDKFKSKEWRIAYGYMRFFEDKPLYCRHCFILDRDNNVIDVTLVKLLEHRGLLNPDDKSTYTILETENKIRNKYLVMKIYDDPEDYMNAIDKEELVPALTWTLRKEDYDIQKWAFQNNLMLFG